MCNPEVNETVIMTYVSYFRGAKRKENTPHPTASTKSSAKGPGITRGGSKPKPSRITASTAGKGSARNKEVVLEPRNVPFEFADNGMASTSSYFGKAFSYIQCAICDLRITASQDGRNNRYLMSLWSRSASLQVCKDIFRNPERTP